MWQPWIMIRQYYANRTNISTQFKLTFEKYPTKWQPFESLIVRQ